ncbi:MAG: hypothetical protein JW768_00265 [Chitinispirillaceae bacterium]|nr:hypothetical protein [Chitinispirillaceae bacterium]
MFPRLKARLIAVAAGILLTISMAAGQGYVLEWEVDSIAGGMPILPISIFNAEGRLLRLLVNGPQKIGEYAVLWDGRTDGGEAMASGPYFYRLKVGDFVSSKKMFILK